MYSSSCDSYISGSEDLIPRRRNIFTPNSGKLEEHESESLVLEEDFVFKEQEPEEKKEVKQPRKSKKSKNLPKCSATTKKGEPCKNKVQEGEELCNIHIKSRDAKNKKKIIFQCVATTFKGVRCRRNVKVEGCTCKVHSRSQVA